MSIIQRKESLETSTAGLDSESIFPFSISLLIRVWSTFLSVMNSSLTGCQNVIESSLANSLTKSSAPNFLTFESLSWELKQEITKIGK